MHVLSRLERPGDDFPYYDGSPTWISGLQWLCLMMLVAAGFFALSLPPPASLGHAGDFVPVILFCAIPLAGLAIVTPRHWTALFRRLQARDLPFILGLTVLNVVATVVVGGVVFKLFGASPNPAVEIFGDLSATGKLLFMLRTIPQLFGEELLAILPFLAILSVCHTRLRLSRAHSVLLAWLLSSIPFALAHLPTYDWNLAQCLLIIGTARLIISLAYLRTKNLLVCTAVHILNDWVLLSLVALAPVA